MLQDLMNSWKAFSASKVVEAFSASKVVEAFSLKTFVEILEEVVRGQLVRGQMNTRDKVKPCNLIYSTFEMVVMWLGFIMWKNLVYSAYQYQMQALQSSVHLIDLLSILLRCNGFTGIQKAVVDQMGNRQPNSDHDLLWYKFGFGNYFGASYQSNH